MVTINNVKMEKLILNPKSVTLSKKIEVNNPVVRQGNKSVL